MSALLKLLGVVLLLGGCGPGYAEREAAERQKRSDELRRNLAAIDERKRQAVAEREQRDREWAEAFQEQRQADAAERAERERQKQQEREAYVAAHPERPADLMELYLKGKITLGMTEEEVRFNLPADVRISNTSRMVSALGVRTQWSLTSLGAYFPHAYMFFDGGVLTSFHD